jgi:hypothetical protein
LRILFYLEWKHSDAIFNGFDLFSKPCVKRKSHLDEKEWVIKPCHLFKVVVLDLLENVMTKPNCSELQKVTAVIVGVLDEESVAILAVLRRMNQSLKVLFHSEERFDKRVKEELTDEDNVLILNFFNIQDQSEILTILLQVMENGATIVGVFELLHGRLWAEKLRQAGSFSGARVRLLFDTPILSEDEYQETTLCRHFFDSFEGWDQLSTKLLTDDDIQSMINRALYDGEQLFNFTRALHLMQNFSRWTNTDDRIKGWLRESDERHQSITSACDAAKDLDGGVWRIISGYFTAYQRLSVLKNRPPLIIREDLKHSDGPRVYFHAKHEISADAVLLAKEGRIPFEASGSLVWVNPADEEAMLETYREVLNPS